MAEIKIEARDCSLFYKPGKVFEWKDGLVLEKLCEYFENTSEESKDDDDKIASLQTLRYPYDGLPPTIQTRWWAGRYIGLAKIVFQPTEKSTCQAEISIRPRFGQSFLLTILEDLYHIKVGTHDGKVENSSEWFSNLLNILRRRMWVEKCMKANRYGLPRVNAKRERQGVTLRGALDVRRTIMPWLKQKEVCTNVYEKVLDDNICRIVYEAHRILSKDVISNKEKKSKKNNQQESNKGFGFSMPSIVQDTINTLNGQFKGTAFDLTENDYRQIHYKSIYATWKPLVDFSWAVIRSKRLGYRSADCQTECIFVDMAEIWESFLRKKLCEGFAGDGWRVLSVKECHYPIYQGQFFAREIIPDIILSRQKENGEKEYMVFDAKYKRMRGVKEDVDRTDIFQIHTYIQYVQHYLGKVLIGGLLYPITSKGKDGGITEEKNNSSLYFSNYLFGCEGKYDTPFIIDGILFPELKEDEKTITEDMMDKNAELMNKKVEAMIDRIKNRMKNDKGNTNL